MENLLAIGLWIPAVTRASGILEVPVHFEALWIFLLTALCLDIAARKSDRAAVVILVYALVVCAIMSIATLIVPINTVRWADLGAVYGRAAAFYALLLLNFIPGRVGRDKASAAETAFFSLALALDVFFVVKLRDDGMSLSLAAIPALFVAVSRYSSERPEKNEVHT